MLEDTNSLDAAHIKFTNDALKLYNMSPVKRICVFEHSVMTIFNCACPAIQKGQESGFLSEGSSWLTACVAWTFAARIEDKYQIRLTLSI